MQISSAITPLPHELIKDKRKISEDSSEASSEDRSEASREDSI
jgi:hypothetical protein